MRVLEVLLAPHVITRRERGDGRGRPMKNFRRESDQRSNINKSPPLPDYVTSGEECGMANTPTGTSIFDPVLCEIIYTWFGFKGAKVLDPFAGGSVRGLVASYLGLDYTGIELRPEQVEENKKQATELKLNPKWITGDSINVKTLASAEYDLIFSCPPYYNLEVYSNLEGELSAIPTYKEFIEKYEKIISESVSMLKDNRFACFVVGDIRDKQGFYLNFVSDTIKAFQDAGMTLYNEAILINVLGSLPIRVGKQFNNYRKLGKTHQNVLVFYKGDVKQIPKYFSDLGYVTVNKEKIKNG